MEADESAEKLSVAEQAIVDILEIAALQGYTLDNSRLNNPVLVDVKGTPACECIKLSRVTDDLIHFDNDQNLTLLDSDPANHVKGLGTVYFVLTALDLKERGIRLCSDYDSAATITSSSRGLWNKFVRLGLAHKDPKMYRYFFDIPEGLDFKKVQTDLMTDVSKLAPEKALSLVAEIKARLKKTAAGEVLAKPE